MTEIMSRIKRSATFRKIREHNFHGCVVEIYRNGFYFWDTILFKSSGRELYKFEKISAPGKNCVNECFDSELEKTRPDHYNNFIGFSIYLSKSKKFPEPLGFLTAGELLGLEMADVDLYRDYYNKFFGPK